MYHRGRPHPPPRHLHCLIATETASSRWSSGIPNSWETTCEDVCHAGAAAGEDGLAKSSGGIDDDFSPPVERQPDQTDIALGVVLPLPQERGLGKFFMQPPAAQGMWANRLSHCALARRILRRPAPLRRSSDSSTPSASPMNRILGHPAARCGSAVIIGAPLALLCVHRASVVTETPTYRAASCTVYSSVLNRSMVTAQCCHRDQGQGCPRSPPTPRAWGSAIQARQVRRPRFGCVQHPRPLRERPPRNRRHGLARSPRWVPHPGSGRRCGRARRQHPPPPQEATHAEAVRRHRPQSQTKHTGLPAHSGVCFVPRATPPPTNHPLTVSWRRNRSSRPHGQRARTS